jgi:hypothetical protein
VKDLTRRFEISRTLFASLTAFIFFSCNSTPQPNKSSPTTAHQTGCSVEQRSETLRELQKQVLSVAPGRIESLDAAVRPGGQLAGWQLTHGFVVLAGGGVELPAESFFLSRKRTKRVSGKEALSRRLLFSV